jgi:hypothetical protein
MCDQTRSNAAIKAVIEGAFRPLRCVAEIWDYDKQIRFRVFNDRDEVVLTMPAEQLSAFGDDGRLTDTVQVARSRVEERGFKLEPWELPDPRP